MQDLDATVSANAPRVLVADDDAPSRQFLGEALRQLGAVVETCPDGPSALVLMRQQPFDLLLLDFHMPGLGAVGVLGELRHDPLARSVATPAVVSSAELDSSAQQALLAAGFHAVLLKPCTVQQLRDILLLALGSTASLPVLDDHQALHASGSPAVVEALRGLFYQELASLDGELDTLSQDAEQLHARLHKLRSSCGFCGASALGEHIASLQSHLKLAHQRPMWPLAAFRRSLQNTMDALRP